MSESSDDVVAELDRWRRTPRVAENAHEFVPISELFQRARDEIVALRAQFEAIPPLRIAIADALAAGRREACAEALEAAAQLAHDNGFGEIAAAIRALKDKG